MTLRPNFPGIIWIQHRTGTFTASESVAPGRIISTTATRKTGASTYDVTSEFSKNHSIEASLVVVNTNDSGPGSLREAIAYANAYGAEDNITFVIPGAGPHVITLATILPPLTDDDISIDGLTQSGASCGQLTTGIPHTLKVRLDGTGASSLAGGLRAQAPGVTIKGLSITNMPREAVSVGAGETNFIMECTYVGVDVDGETALANNRNDTTGTAVTITGANAILRNSLISGNTIGGRAVNIDANDAVVQGNIIGLNALGTIALGNKGQGIRISGGSNAVIGGTTPETRNVISGNLADGISMINGAGSATIQGNYIGLSRTGAAGFGNGRDGINMGATTSAAIIENLINGNSGQNIDLDGDDTTPNDVGDIDSGANDLLNFPAVNSMVAIGATSLMYDFDLDVPANTEGYRIEFYKGSGAVFLGFFDTGNHAGGSVNFNGTFTASETVTVGDIVTLTATRKTGATSYDITSESSYIRAATGSLVVLNTNDSGGGSLREAINAANASTSMDNITFAIPGAGPHTITLTSYLPSIKDAGVMIDGTSQSGASCGQLTTGTPHTLKIRIDGTGASFSTAGLRAHAPGVTIKGVAVTNMPVAAIDASSVSDGLVLECSYIGVDVDGETAHTNNFGKSAGNTINILAPNSVVRNSLVSGNTDGGRGINIGANNSGNYILA